MNEFWLIFAVGVICGLALWWAYTEDEKDQSLGKQVETILSRYLRH